MYLLEYIHRIYADVYITVVPGRDADYYLEQVRK